jgi:uncharacterized phage infection (PIP) family protein YhgE
METPPLVAAASEIPKKWFTWKNADLPPIRDLAFKYRIKPKMKVNDVLKMYYNFYATNNEPEATISTAVRDELEQISIKVATLVEEAKKSGFISDTDEFSFIEILDAMIERSGLTGDKSIFEAYMQALELKNRAFEEIDKLRKTNELQRKELETITQRYNSLADLMKEEMPKRKQVPKNPMVQMRSEFDEIKKEMKKQADALDNERRERDKAKADAKALSDKVKALSDKEKALNDKVKALSDKEKALNDKVSKQEGAIRRMTTSESSLTQQITILQGTVKRLNISHAKLVVGELLRFYQDLLIASILDIPTINFATYHSRQHGGIPPAITDMTKLDDYLQRTNQVERLAQWQRLKENLREATGMPVENIVDTIYEFNTALRNPVAHPNMTNLILQGEDGVKEIVQDINTVLEANARLTDPVVSLQTILEFVRDQIMGRWSGLSRAINARPGDQTIVKMRIRPSSPPTGGPTGPAIEEVEEEEEEEATPLQLLHDKFYYDLLSLAK